MRRTQSGQRAHLPRVVAHRAHMPGGRVRHGKARAEPLLLARGPPGPTRCSEPASRSSASCSSGYAFMRQRAVHNAVMKGDFEQLDERFLAGVTVFGVVLGAAVLILVIAQP